MSIVKLSRDEQIELLMLKQTLDDRKRKRTIDGYFPDKGPLRRELYSKHCQFMAAGAEYKFRLFMAGNRTGKSLSAAFELACHLTGVYPHWWTGKKFQFSQNWWVCGVDSKTILNTLQPLLLGQVGEFGTGMIPHDCLDFETLKDAKRADTPISMFRVKHACGTHSSVSFKSYESGREAFQAFAGSIWLDEEPPLSVFTECAMRTATGDNILMMTFTPLKGISETILNFLEGSQFAEGPIGVGKHVTMTGWDDVPHLSERDKQILIASIPPYQRDARTKGIPQLGSGAVYPVPESDYVIAPFEIPKHWRRVYGLDVGWNRTAAVWAAIDPQTNIIHLYNEYYKGEAEPSIHAVGIKSRGDWIPGIIDTAARGRSQIDGDNLFQMYKDLGLKINNANKSVETGLYTCWELLSTGQIKVFSTMTNFMNEIRMYRRDEKGKIIKSNDHLMDAFRYLIMTGRDIAKTEQESKPQNINYGVSQQYRPQPMIRR
jgi:phage terminase large subunit-like protein